MPEHRTDPKMPEGRAVAVGPADVRPLDRAYFLDVLGDSHNSLGRHRAAIEVYRQAAQAFQQQNTQIAYALCLLKIAQAYRSLDQAEQAAGYLEICLPLLRELGLGGAEQVALSELAACRTRFRPQASFSPQELS
jgi:tetratricopeptide (TPR) repeat protein